MNAENKKTVNAVKKKARPGAFDIGSELEEWLQAIEREQIARRAREIYTERGGKPGHDMEYWLEAEAELRKQLEEASRIAQPEVVIRAARDKSGKFRVKSVAFRMQGTNSEAQSTEKVENN